MMRPLDQQEQSRLEMSQQVNKRNMLDAALDNQYLNSQDGTMVVEIPSSIQNAGGQGQNINYNNKNSDRSNYTKQRNPSYSNVIKKAMHQQKGRN